MKIWASILAAGAILALAAPTCNAAASFTAGPSDAIAGPGIIHRALSQPFALGDPLRGQHQFLAQVHQPRSAAAATLTAQLDHAAEQTARPSWWQLFIDYRFALFLW
jgi:hypothetical protein